MQPRCRTNISVESDDLLIIEDAKIQGHPEFTNGHHILTALKKIAREEKIEFKLKEPLRLDAILPKTVSKNATYQVIAQFPDGRIEPLLWFQNYDQQYPGNKQSFAHPFLLRQPIVLPAGTLISGVPTGDTIALLPAAAGTAPAKPLSGN